MDDERRSREHRRTTRNGITTDVDVQITVAGSVGRRRSRVVSVQRTSTSRSTTSDPSHDKESTPMDRKDDSSTRTPAELSPEELQAQGGEALPDREAMSLINANLAAPVNAAAALNVLSDDSTAIANAEQTAVIDQSN